jgi:hypothetical protein
MLINPLLLDQTFEAAAPESIFVDRNSKGSNAQLGLPTSQICPQRPVLED